MYEEWFRVVQREDGALEYVPEALRTAELQTE